MRTRNFAPTPMLCAKWTTCGSQIGAMAAFLTFFLMSACSQSVLSEAEPPPALSAGSAITTGPSACRSRPAAFSALDTLWSFGEVLPRRETISLPSRVASASPAFRSLSV